MVDKLVAGHTKEPTLMMSTRKLRILCGVLLRMSSIESSVTLQPIALADSMANVMLSLRASLLRSSEAVADILVRARRSTVLGTALLISLLCVCVCVCGCGVCTHRRKK